jgi:hypothetical protein
MREPAPWRADLATSAGHAGRPNEDFAGVVPGAAVLLDGAGIPGAEAVCSHGVAWFTHRLGGTLLGRLSRGDGRDLPTILGDAISELAADHRATCDIESPISPQATVAIVRSYGESLDFLLLADSFLVLDRAHGGPEVLTDEREVTAQRIAAAPLQGIPKDSPEYATIRADCARNLRSQRNQPGGYWIAKDNPAAARHAVIGSRPLSELDGVVLLSNGVTRAIPPHNVLPLLTDGGAAAVITRVRAHDTDPDDATVVHCTGNSSATPRTTSVLLPPTGPAGRLS